VRVTTAFKRLVRLDGVNVTDVVFGINTVTIDVALKRRKLLCPHCAHSSTARYDTRTNASTWRHLDLGVWRVEVRATLRRLRCPTHGVVVEGVPFARPGAHLTRDYDDLLAWLATRMDKTSVARLCRVSWRTVGRACQRVVATELDPDRLDGLFRIGVDEISWRKHHKYLTLVVDHDRGVVVWGANARTYVARRTAEDKRHLANRVIRRKHAVVPTHAARRRHGWPSGPGRSKSTQKLRAFCT
jgi:transposase